MSDFINNVRIRILDRNYASWCFYEVEERNEINIEEFPLLKKVNPLLSKIFTDDVINIDNLEKDNTVNIVNSVIRSNKQLAGVLHIENNKTFGRTENKKRLLYKCIPDDKHLPSFLIPYDINIGFSKTYTNLFVTFTFDHWNDKHPRGILSQTIGTVDNLDNFYEYQLYCKSLHTSIANFNKKTRDALNKSTQDEYIDNIFKNTNYNIQDRRDTYIFTIDSSSTTDYDDGFSIQKLDDGWKVSIYIANVFLWLETLDLWNAFSQRVSTIYLPDRRRPMLPTILSDNLCSLQEDTNRFAYVVDYFVNNEGIIEEEKTSYSNVLIKVNHNYSYDSRIMVGNDEYYNELLSVSNLMDKNIQNSHDVVAHWMVQMNAHIGVTMIEKKIGIFRSLVFINVTNEQNINEVEITDDAKRVIKTWNNTSGKYIAYNDTDNLNHEMMNIKSFKKSNFSKSATRPYIHITSPIRRLVDLLNQIILFQELKLVNKISDNALTFLNSWVQNMEYINTSMRCIRKVQNDCDILNKCVVNPEYMENPQRGVIFDKVIKTNGLFMYMVYLEDLKLLYRINSHDDFDNYTYHNFRMFLFNDEDTFKRKIRLQFD